MNNTLIQKILDISIEEISSNGLLHEDEFEESTECSLKKMKVLEDALLVFQNAYSKRLNLKELKVLIDSQGEVLEDIFNYRILSYFLDQFDEVKKEQLDRLLEKLIT